MFENIKRSSHSILSNHLFPAAMKENKDDFFLAYQTGGSSFTHACSKFFHSCSDRMVGQKIEPLHVLSYNGCIGSHVQRREGINVILTSLFQNG